MLRYGWALALVYELMGTFAAGAVIGWLLDRWLGSAPWALIVCSLLAIVGGFIRLVKAVRRLEHGDLGSES